MARRSDDSTVWIGYSDFLMTLTVLFLVFTMVFAGRLHSGRRSGWIKGTVTGAASAAAASCDATLGTAREQRANENGTFVFQIDSLRDEINVGLQVQCHGYGVYSKIWAVKPGETTFVPVPLVKDTTLTLGSLQGDALFEPGESKLKPEAIGLLQEKGREYAQQLAGDTLAVIAVQGHTDDAPFPVGAKGDNWRLSGERAAAAAKIFTDSTFGVGIPRCRVVTMGFGPSRPVAPVLTTDSDDIVEAKRQRNRRIEFRLFSSDLSGRACAR